MNKGKEICKSDFFSKFIKVCASGTSIPRLVAIKTTTQTIRNSLCETQTLRK